MSLGAMDKVAQVEWLEILGRRAAWQSREVDKVLAEVAGALRLIATERDVIGEQIKTYRCACGAQHSAELEALDRRYGQIELVLAPKIARLESMASQSSGKTSAA